MAVLACSSVCFLASFRNSRDCENNMPRYLYLSVDNYFWFLTVFFLYQKWDSTLSRLSSQKNTLHIEHTYIFSDENNGLSFCCISCNLVYPSSGAIWLWP